MNLVIARVFKFRYNQLIVHVELPGVIVDNETPQQQDTQQHIEKAVEIQYELDMTHVDTATTEPNPIEQEPQHKVKP